MNTQAEVSNTVKALMYLRRNSLSCILDLKKKIRSQSIFLRFVLILSKHSLSPYTTEALYVNGADIQYQNINLFLSLLTFCSQMTGGTRG